MINHRIHLGLQRTFASNAVLKHIQRSLGNSGFMSAILISLSKVYDSLPHYLFTVNLVSHSFQNSNLFQIHHVIYLVKNKLGSCIANLLILMFLIITVITRASNFADENRIYDCGNN